MFWESVNAIGVLQAPAVITVYDDGYGISVPNQFQMVKENIHDILRASSVKPAPNRSASAAMNSSRCAAGIIPRCSKPIKRGGDCARVSHPRTGACHDLTQPQGHSTSGSHERYKSPERMKWEEEFDCIRKMREWMIESASFRSPS
jgi:2-oxoisovalerate dehydrogenase E1 component